MHTEPTTAPEVKTDRPKEDAARPLRPVVLLRMPGAAHGAAADWARAFARGLATELLVARVEGTRPPNTDVLFPQHGISRSLAGIASGSRALRARLRWHAAHAPGATVPPLATLDARGLAEAIELLAGLEPRLVVVPARRGLAEDLKRLCVAARAPTLFATTRPRGAPVVAASSLTHPGTPVLTAAARFARVLERRLTFLHNDTRARPADGAVAADEGLRWLRRLEVLARVCDADVTVTRQHDTAQGILSVARRAAADLVVLGARSSHSLGSRVTTRVLEAWRRSVLLVPLGAMGAP